MPTETARDLLGVPSFTQLVREALSRFQLAAGGFESQELGQQQPSVSSGAALVGAAAAVSEISDHDLRDAVEAFAGFAAAPERGRGEADDTVLTSWASAQALVALLKREQLVPNLEVLESLLTRVLALQDGDSGGWRLRPDEPSDQPIFAFYPTLALVRWCRFAGVDVVAEERLELAAGFHARVAANAAVPVELRLLSLAALRRTEAFVSVSDDQLSARARLEDDISDRCIDKDGRLKLEDRPAYGYRQPLWYAAIWRPLLYLARRHRHPPVERIQALLSHELVTSFDPVVQGWRGPVPAANAVSWATGLGLQAIYALATDLETTGVSVAEWHARGEYLVGEPHEFDIAISFGGPDRAVAETIRSVLAGAGFRVFYDFDYQHELLGEDLAVTLQRTYYQRSRFAIALLSEAFLESNWGGNWEWRAILARMVQEREAYLLPYLVEDVEAPGLNPTIGYISAKRCSPEEFARIVIRKLTVS
jgi:hypothetical protein